MKRHVLLNLAASAISAFAQVDGSPKRNCREYLHSQLIPDTAVTRSIGSVDFIQESLVRTKNRFDIFLYESKTGSIHSIFDHETATERQVMSRSHARIYVSTDGKRLIETIQSGSRKDSSLRFDNVLVFLPDAATKPVVVPMKDSTAQEFSGRIVAHTPDLSHFVVDKSHDGAVHPLSSYPTVWLAPELELVELERGRLKAKKLPRWNVILKWIKKLAQQGTTIPIFGVLGKMTDNGHHLAISIKFGSGSFTHNWIGLWDLHHSIAPMVFTSTMLDSPFDEEPTPTQSTPAKDGRSCRRQFTSGILPDGHLIAVRSIVQDPPSNDPAKVSIKIGVARIGQTTENIWSYHTTIPKLDSTCPPETWTGTAKFNLTPTGQQLILEVADAGTFIIDLVKAGIIKNRPQN